MSQVSKRKLDPELERKIFHYFFLTLSSLNKKELEKFLDDFLSPTERTMLAKRLAIALLLSKGYDYRQISQVLKVSICTVGSVSLMLKLEKGGLRRAVGKALRRESIKKLVAELIGDFFYGGILPPKYRNWREWSKEKQRYKKKLESP
jgi:uncharacterized protein YerC